MPPVKINEVSPKLLFDMEAKLTMFGDFTAVKELGIERFTIRLPLDGHHSISVSSFHLVGEVADVGMIDL